MANLFKAFVDPLGFREDVINERRQSEQDRRTEAFGQYLGAVPFAPFQQQGERGQAETLSKLTQSGPVGQSIALQELQANVPLTQTQQQQLTNLQLEEQQIQANIQKLSMDSALAYSMAGREVAREITTDENQLRGEYNKDPVILKAGQATQAFSQLGNLMRIGDSVAMQAAITAIAQIQEPGLAVRQDDRLAYSGQNPFIEQMVNSYNKALGGDVSPETFARLQQAATALLLPHLQLAATIEEDYAFLSGQKGLDARNILIGTGFSPSAMLKELGQTVNFNDVTNNSGIIQR